MGWDTGEPPFKRPPFQGDFPKNHWGIDRRFNMISHDLTTQLVPSGKQPHSHIAIKNGQIVSFPMNSTVMFHSYVAVYQRVI